MTYLFRTLFTALCLILSSCSTHNNRGKHVRAWMEPNDKLKVLSTIGMIDDLVRSIGKEHVDALALITGELDPHSYQLVKGDDEKVAAADLIFYNGLNLEHGPSLKKTLKENPRAVGLGDLIRAEDPSLILEVNGQLDPHIWMDIALWKKTIPYIAEALIRSDPNHAEEYRNNAKQLENEFDSVHKKIRDALQKIPENRRYLVTSHDAFNYFTRSYLATDQELANNSWHKRFAAPEGLAPDSQLSSSDIKAIINHLEKYNIHVLFPESNVSRDSIHKIVEAGKSKGLTLSIANCPLYGDAMGQPGSEGDTYLKMVQHNATLIQWYLENSPKNSELKCK